MAITIPIRRLTALRPGVPDQTLLDYLDLAILAPDPGTITTKVLRERWACSQPMVSRRLAALQRAGLADITAGWGEYQVHAVRQWEVPA